MDLGLAGKTAIVTGGGSNIGRAIALTFAREGSNVVIAEIDEAQGKKVEEQANALKGRGKALVIPTDVTNLASVEAMAKRALQELGKIDILVNNVGWDTMKFFLEYSLEEIERIIKLNYLGMLYCCRAVLPHMIERKQGSVVSLSSDAGRMGEFKEPIYSGMKAGIIGLTKSLAREMGRFGIRLNVICPGLTIPQSPDEVGTYSMTGEKGSLRAIFTPEVLERAKGFYPLRRLGTAQEVANAVAFVASDAASFITGQTLSVSGGYTMM